MQLRLHDVDDASAFVSAIVTRSGLRLDFHDREDLEQHLLVEIWSLSLKFEPGRQSFSSWAGNALRFKLIDWRRARFGRSVWKFRDHTHIRPRVELVSFDDEAERNRLGKAVGAGGMADDPSGTSDQLRLLDARGRRPGGRDELLGF